MRKALLAIPLLSVLAACATVGNVKLDANKAFLTADTAFLSLQQTVNAACSVPTVRHGDACVKAIGILHTGATAEAAGFTAIQAGNAADLMTAVTTLNNLPAQLVALGLLKAN
jgi:hypothetical protein